VLHGHQVLQPLLRVLDKRLQHLIQLISAAAAAAAAHF
jgi:hypothetical protein